MHNCNSWNKFYCFVHCHTVRRSIISLTHNKVIQSTKFPLKSLQIIDNNCTFAPTKEKKMIKTKQEVEQFLSQFGIKFDIWGIFYLDRDKNIEALKALGINQNARDEIVRHLQPDDYVETLPADFFNEMWVFGRDMDGTELYIKIALGQPNNRTICISFHLAERPISYAFK